MMMRETQIQKVRAEEAARRVDKRREGDVARGPGSKEVVVQEVRRQVEERDYVDKRRLVSFLAWVINCTYRIDGRTEKLRIVVEGARRHLGLEGLEWKEVQKEIEEKEDRREREALGSQDPAD